VENFGSGKSDGDFGIGVVSVIVDVSDMGIVGYEGFEDVVVIVEIEGDGVSQCFSP
jgi:hypothetical protein